MFCDVAGGCAADADAEAIKVPFNIATLIAPLLLPEKAARDEEEAHA